MGALQYRTCAGNPNTLNEVGALTEKIYDTVNGIEYQCKTAGTGAWYSKDGLLKGEVKEFIASYSFYSGTNPPAFNYIVKNTITPGSAPVFSYVDVGHYHLTFIEGARLSAWTLKPFDIISLTDKWMICIQRESASNTIMNIYTYTWTTDILQPVLANIAAIPMNEQWIEMKQFLYREGD